MRYLLTSILLFITINCLAIDQKLIGGAKKYDAAVANLHEILDSINASSMSVGEFIEELHKTTDINLSDEDRAAAQNKIDETHKHLSELNLQYDEAEALVKNSSH